MSKERLVELIEKAKVLRSLDILSGDPDVIVDMPTEDEYTADYLLENGVIVPPCKVGDIVYEVVAHYSYIMPREVVGFHLGNFPTYNGHERKPYLVCYDKRSRLLRHIPLDKLGKTAFFKIEEAEAKLKESESK